MLPELQAGDGRATARLLVPLTTGGAQLGGGRRVRFTNLRAGLRQQGQRTLLGIQLQRNIDCDELCVVQRDSLAFMQKNEQGP